MAHPARNIHLSPENKIRYIELFEAAFVAKQLAMFGNDTLIGLQSRFTDMAIYVWYQNRRYSYVSTDERSILLLPQGHEDRVMDTIHVDYTDEECVFVYQQLVVNPWLQRVQFEQDER